MLTFLQNNILWHWLFQLHIFTQKSSDKNGREKSILPQTHKFVQMLRMKNCQNVAAHRALRKATTLTFASDVFRVFFATFSSGYTSFI